MIKTLIAGNSTSKSAGFFWNMMGSSMYAASSLLLTYLTIRMVGEYAGGAFAFALTIAQLLANIVYYETRNYQVTDTTDSFDFCDYHSVKIINSIVMMIITMAFIVIRGYDHTKGFIIAAVCLYRMLDGYADGYESHFHAKGRLDLAGKSMTFRAVISLSCYFIVLHITSDVITSIIAGIIGAVIGIIVFDILIFDTVGTVGISLNTNNIKRIIRDCFPLFAGMFLWTYILSASRIAVDAVMDDSYQAYFQVLFLPVSVINLFATFILKPNLTELAEHYSKKEKRFISITVKLCGALIVFTIICMFGAYILGVPVLKIVSGLDITQYRMMFVFLIFAGGINALGYLFYSLLLIFRRSKEIMGTYIAASLLAGLISTRMTGLWGLWGASASYLIAASLIMTVFGIMVFIECRTIKKLSASGGINA